MKNIKQYENPGRPRYEMKFPTGAEWTFVQLMKRNGVDTNKRLPNGKDNPDYGKGENCTMLTLRNNLDYCIYQHTAKGKVSKRKGIDPKSIVVPIEGVTAEPDSDSGLGRRATLYRLRAVPAKDHSAEIAAAPVTATRKARKPRKSTTEDLNCVPMLSNEEYEALKAPVSTPATTIAPAPIPQTVAESVTAGATVETIVAPVTTPTVEETAVVVPVAENMVASELPAPAPASEPVLEKVPIEDLINS